MKISFLAPDKGIYSGNRNWLWWVAEELKNYHEVYYNQFDDNMDVILCMTDSMTPVLRKFHEKSPRTPIITYIWDWFSFVDTTKGNYPAYLEMMRKSKDVWTSTNYMVRRMKDLHGIDCHKIKPCSVLKEFENIQTNDLGYVVQASRRDSRYKRFEFFERGCKELGIPFESCHPFKYRRRQYINILAGCRALVVATCEDANTALSAIEASYLKKPVILSDIRPHQEEFGDNAHYFKTDDLEDFKRVLLEVCENPDANWVKGKASGAYRMVMQNHTPQSMAKAMADRINELWIKS